MDFIIYTCDNGATDAELYGINKGAALLTGFLKNYLVKMQNILIAVSYTHLMATRLNSWKQPMHILQTLIYNLCMGCFQEFSLVAMLLQYIFHKGQMNRKHHRNQYGVIPVSYTHLDVYKRQV